MIIKEYTAEELKQFIESDAYRNMPAIPISHHRALSHIHNPRLEKEDMIMFVAYEEDKMIGYLGVLPDQYFIYDRTYKAGWMSCLWIDPNTRGKGVAKKLVSQALQTWDERLFATEFTPEARSLYMRIGAFAELTTLEGIRCFMRFNLHEVLPQKNTLFKIAKPILRLTDAVLNPLNELRLQDGHKRKSNHQTNIEWLKEIDDEAEAFMEDYQADEFHRRSIKELSWIIQFPWILPMDKEDGLKSKYYFSSFDKRFEFKFLKVRDEAGVLIAFMLISIRNDRLKVPYAYIEPLHIGEAAHALMEIMLKEKLSTLTTYNKLLVQYLHTSETPFVFKKAIKREILAARKIMETLPEGFVPTLQDGDGDCAFT
jgi:GNAT superfamily N-acetyltransferase